VTFRGLSKVKSMEPSYVPLRAQQLLSETFLSTGFSFRDIGLDHLKWDTLYIHKMYCEISPIVHKKIDKIKMNIKVLYRLTIFAIIIKILIFEIALMRARREKRSYCSRYSPVQFIKHWLPARWRSKRENVRLLNAWYCRSYVCHTPHRAEGLASMVATHNRDYNIMKQTTIHI